MCAKATATAVVEMSKAAVSHFGTTSCPVTTQLANTNPNRAEDQCHKLPLATEQTGLVDALV